MSQSAALSKRSKRFFKCKPKNIYKAEKLNTSMMQPIRKTAYKLWISNIVNAEPIMDIGKFKGVTTIINQNKVQVNRVNIIANVIDVFKIEEKQYGSITLDDSSASIRVKFFNQDIDKMKDINIGDTIMVIGQLRMFNDEIYITPEIVRKVDAIWLLARKLELEKIFKLKAEQQATSQITQTQEENTNIMASNNTENNVIKSNATITKPNAETDQTNELLPNETSNENDDNVEDKTITTAIIKQKIVDALKQNEEIEIDKLMLSLQHNHEDIKKALDELIEDAVVYESRPGVIKLM